MSQFPPAGKFPEEPFPSSPELAGNDGFDDPFADGWGTAPAAGSPFGTPTTPTPPPPHSSNPSMNGYAYDDDQDQAYASDEYAGDDYNQQQAQATVNNPFLAEPSPVPADPFAQPAGAQVEVYEDPFDGLSDEVADAVSALLARITDDDCSEVIMNGPAEVLIKVKGQRYHDPAINFGDAETYHRVINDFVLPYVDTTDLINGKNVLIEGQMEVPAFEEGLPPTLARIHLLCPPLTQFAKATIAKKARYEYDVDILAESGSMSPEMADFLKAVAHGRLTFIVSGVTGAGKTTLLQAMSHYFDSNDRIIVVEDTPELRLPIADVVYLNSTTIKPGQDMREAITIEWLVRQAQRMRMDRVIVGEVRGAEMYEFLLAANSGADGSATTVHADSPRRALDKMLALAAKGSGNTQEMTLRREIAATVNVIIQASLIDGRHVITAIEEISPTITSAGLFQTQTLFRYDKSRGYHVVENAPSDDLRSLLQMRGVAVNPAWFPTRGRY